MARPSYTRPSYRLRGYDQETGQVFEETQVRVTSMLYKWPYRSTGQKQDPARYRHPGEGSPSLYSMAMRSCVWNIDSFLPSDLQCAEWHFAQRIYAHLDKHRNMTPHVWSIFQQAFPNEMSEISNALPIRIPGVFGEFPVELPSIEKWLLAVTIPHLLMLHIQGLVLRLEHLIDITRLPNLGVLFLRDPLDALAQHLDDKSMRDWSRIVVEKKAFARLRVVGIHHFPSSLQATLKCLATFPAVRICTVEPYVGPFEERVTEQQAGILVAKAKLPFELVSEAIRGGPQDPDMVWRKESVSDHSKMEQLYDIACESLAPQLVGEKKKPPVISVRYGLRGNLGSDGLRRWFQRTGDTQLSNATRQAEKHKQRHGDELAENSGENKKRKIRQGKQSDIGSILSSFG